ncbi:MAG: trigger factor [Spirochaetes bacterium]|nr:MAG: trigger factor [Spirochaetota bacterium]
MIDNKQFDKQENSSVKLTVTVTADGAEKAYNALLGKYGKNAQIPGFRKGKVPKDVLIRKFGEGIKHEAAADLIDTALQEALKDVKENPLSQPTLEDLPAIELGKPFVFSVTYDVFPEIKMPEYKGVEIEEAQVKILKKHETEELDSIRERNSVVMDKKDGTIAQDAVVTMDYVELGDDDAPLEETRRKGFAFTVGTNAHPYAIDKELEGMKVDESKVLEKTFADDADSPYAGRTIKLEVKITAVKERELPELDDELAQDVSEDLKTLDDLKKKVKADLKERAESKIRARKINSLTDKLVEAAEIDVPESMISSDLEHTWQDYVRQSGATEEQLVKALEDAGRSKADILNEWRDDAKKSIKTRLIFGRIVEDEKIEAGEEEVAAEMEKRAEEFKMPVEEMEKMFGGAQFREYLKSELAQKKLFDFLLGAASVTKGEKIDYTELMGA